MRSFKHTARSLCALAWIATLSPWSGAAADDFYKGKSINFIIGSAAGGGYDTYSRLLARHIGRHLNGQPAVIPQNMPGAGSVRAENYLYNVAPKDGTVIGMVDEAIYLHQVLSAQDHKTDATKFNWVGRILANSAVLFARSEASVHKIEDVFEKELIVSTSGTASRLNWTVLKRLLGMKFTIISGYQGSNDSLLALVRGEVDALSMPWSILRVTGGALMRDKKINLLLQTGAEKDADLPHIPRMIDLARNDDERRLLEFFASPSRIGRSVVAPPEMPSERVEELRRAFMATMADPIFRGDVEKAKLEISPLPGAELQTIVARTKEQSEPLIERARRVAAPAKD